MTQGHEQLTTRNLAQGAGKAAARAVAFLVLLAEGVAKTALVAMMLYVAMDAAGRYLFASPLPSSYELIENVFMIVVVFLSLAGLQRVNGNVSVTLIGDMLPRRMQQWLDIVFLALAFAVMSAIAVVHGKSRDSGA